MYIILFNNMTDKGLNSRHSISGAPRALRRCCVWTVAINTLLHLQHKPGAQKLGVKVVIKHQHPLSTAAGLK